MTYAKKSATSESSGVDKPPEHQNRKSEITMFDPNFFDRLAKQLSNLVPPQIQPIREELEANFKIALHSIFSKLKLVTREEFDIQVRLLAKTQMRVAALEEKIQELESNP